MFTTKIDRNPKIASSFWGGDFITRHRGANDVYLLASHRRAIANFVRIVTGNSYPVQFRTDDNSYTDGKTVTIGANVVRPEDFDVAVGLALHEASHIALSDFDMLLSLENAITSVTGPTEYGELLSASSKCGVRMAPAIKNLCNWVEDRRIDEWVYSRAPGYRPYYQSMYNKYFWSKDVTKGLKSASARDETFESYMFRIVNLHNSATDLDALKKLREISEVTDLDNIGRLESTNDALEVAIRIYKLIIEALSEADSQEGDEANTNETGKGKGDGSESEEAEGNGSGNESGAGDEAGDESGAGDEAGDESDEADEEMNGDSSDTKPSAGDELKELSKTAKKKLERAIKKQTEFLEGDVNKKKMDKSVAKNVQVVESSGSELKEVGGGDEGKDSYIKRVGKTKCVVVKKLDQDYIDSDVFPLKMSRFDYTAANETEEAVRKGIRFGKRMVGKLQTRSEERNTMYTRQRRGKIDKRMLNSLGYGNTSVFYVNEVDKFESANLHISVDASYSMTDGNNWTSAMTMVVALATAIEEIPNLDVQVSFRSTIFDGTQDLPYILMAYDSRVDKFSKIRKLFPQLYPNGTTPEGLCFEAIMGEMVQSSAGLKSYFLNLSDGMPYFQNADVSYGAGNAPAHIRSLVNKMNEMGINVLSYFVSADTTGESREAGVFKECYGPAASFIDTENVTQIVKTMNELFMKKD